MSTEDYSKKIWDMLDNPQAYSEEEILALLHDNEEAREAYRQIVEVKRSFRQVHAADKSIDVDKAWERFAAEHPVEVKRHRSLYTSWFTGARKYACPTRPSFKYGIGMKSGRSNLPPRIVSRPQYARSRHPSKQLTLCSCSQRPSTMCRWRKCYRKSLSITA